MFTKLLIKGDSYSGMAIMLDNGSLIEGSRPHAGGSEKVQLLQA